MDIFSVIIPAYNCETFIDEAIKSVLNQDDMNYEIIVVDDGSTDSTFHIAQKYGGNIKVVRQDNSGVAAARNNGAKIASGNTLAFLDADDVWLPNKLSSQNSKLKDGYDMVYTNRFNIGQIGDLPEIQTDIMEMFEGDIWEKLLMSNVVTTSSVVIDKSLFESLNGFRIDLPPCEDWDLWLRCSEKVKVGFCSEPLVKYRMHSAGISRQYKLMSDQRFKVISQALCSDRGRNLSFSKRKRIIAQTWSTSAWDAALGKDYKQVFKCHSRAIWAWPFDRRIWYDIFRLIAGRV